ncbi:MAG: T9SS type A sorting domain-containing protein, partial [Prevotellaceae bacterium]|nr:T9SS type A sorting domain-containing protein [Prevotellaceae bacterium]
SEDDLSFASNADPANQDVLLLIFDEIPDLSDLMVAFDAALNAGSHFEQHLEAGTYFLVSALTVPMAALPFNAHLTVTGTIQQPLYYYDLDYSTTITLGTPVIVNQSDFTEIRDLYWPDNYTMPIADYNFHAEAGHLYSIQINLDFENNGDASASNFLLHENLTQNFDNDRFYTRYGYAEGGNHISVNGVYEAYETENVKLLLNYYNYPSCLFLGSILITEYQPQPQTAITLPELLDAAPEIQYSALPFIETGVFGANTPLVQGDDDNYNFRNTGDNYYAVANKINLTAGQTIKIHEHSEGDSYLYVYKKVSGNYVQAYHNDDWSIGWTGLGYADYDSYLEVTGEGEYYIVATNYSAYNNGGTGAYFFKIWTTATEPETPVKTIVSTTPSVTAIDIAADITDLEIRGALSTLVSLTATTDEPQTFAIYNNPFGWELLSSVPEESNSAIYTNFSIENYELAANYIPAQVTLNIASGINEMHTANLKLYPNPAVDYIAIEGLSGSETISILGIDGKVLTRTNAGGSTQTISVTGLQNGIYLLAIQNGGHIEVLKFVKK